MVSHEYRDSLETVDAPGLLFGQDDHDHYVASYYERYPTLRAAEGSHPVLQRHRAEQRRRRRQRRGRRVLIVLVALIVAAVGLTGWFVVKPFVTSRLAPDDGPDPARARCGSKCTPAKGQPKSARRWPRRG